MSDHEHVAELYDAYEDEKAVHMVLELCKGGELFDRIISKGTFTERMAAGGTSRSPCSANALHICDGASVLVCRWFVFLILITFYSPWGTLSNPPSFFNYAYVHDIWCACHHAAEYTHIPYGEVHAHFTLVWGRGRMGTSLGEQVELVQRQCPERRHG